MSLLASLARAYDRLPDAPPYGFSTEKIGFCVLLNRDGSVAGVEDLRATDKKRSPRMLLVPQAVKRTAGISPNFLWDKTAYTLGVTAGEGKRTAQEHAAFRKRHADWLAGTQDPGLLAFLGFLKVRKIRGPRDTIATVKEAKVALTPGHDKPSSQITARTASSDTSGW